MTPQVAVDIARNGGAFDAILTLGSQRLGLVLEGAIYTQQVTNLAPTFRVGGSGAYNSEAFQAAPWNGTANGGDKDIAESGDLRYASSDGKVATQGERYMTLAAQWNSWDASQTPTCMEIIDFPVGNKFTLLGCATKLRAYDHTAQTWGNKGTFTGSVKHMVSDGTLVWIAMGSGENYWRWNGTTFTQPGSVAADRFAFYDKLLYRSLGGNLIPLAKVKNATEKWGAAQQVGLSQTNITDMKVIGGLLMIAKPEGWFAWDGSAITPVLNTEKTPDVTNFVGAAEFMGTLYWPQKQQIFKGTLSGKKISGATPIAPQETGSEAKERYWHGYPKVFVPGVSGMYIGFDDGEGLYPEVLMYNGIGYHQILKGPSGDTLNAFGYSYQLGFLIVNYGATGTTYYRRVTNVGSSEFPDYAASGSCISPRFDGGFPAFPKLWNQVLVETEGCTSTETVEIKYIKDGAAAVSAATISDNGLHIILLGNQNGQISATNLQVEAVLARGADVTKTPRVKWPIVPYGMPAPQATDAHRADVVIDEEQDLKNSGQGYGKVAYYASTTAYLEFLADARQSLSTLFLVDNFNHWTPVRITNLSPTTHVIAESDLAPREIVVAELAMVSVFPGLTRSVESPVTVSGAVGAIT